MGKVRVAIIGVGNCASSFVQGLHYYKNAKATDRIPGLIAVEGGTRNFALSMSTVMPRLVSTRRATPFLSMSFI